MFTTWREKTFSQVSADRRHSKFRVEEGGRVPRLNNISRLQKDNRGCTIMVLIDKHWTNGTSSDNTFAIHCRLTWGCDELVVQLVSHQRLRQSPETAEHVADTPSLSAHSHTAWLGVNTAVYLQLTVILSYFAWTITGAIHLDMKEIMHSFEDLFEDFHTEKFVL